MAFRLDTRLSEGHLIMWRFIEYGVHKKCLRCPVFDFCNAPQYNAPRLIKFVCKNALREEIMNNKLKEGDRVFCVLNHAITGEITKRANYHGIYLYTIRADDEVNFKKFMRNPSINVVFLHWQLKKLYKDKK